MAYGKIYISQFNNAANEDYLLEIYKKDYTGIVRTITGSSVPVVHSWSTDEPKAPVKGSSIDIKLLNESGGLSLSNFFSTEDDTFLVKFYHDSNLLFIGYLVQSDCQEEEYDFTHEIQLSATDNLGLLKGVSLLEASRLWGTSTDYSTTIGYVGTYIIRVQEGPGAFPVSVGDSVRVNITDINGVPLNGTYLVEQISVVGGVVTNMQVTNPVNPPLGAGSDFPGTITIIEPFDLTQRVTLAQILRLCLLSTNLELNTHVYANIIENGTALPRFLEETYISGEYFLSGSTWQSCYQVLEIILGRFFLTLSQNYGVWNMVRWDEARQYSSLIPGFRYDKDFVYFLDYVFVSTENIDIDGTAPDTMKLVNPGSTYAVGDQIIITGSLTSLDGTYIILTVDTATDPPNVIITLNAAVLTVSTAAGANVDLYHEDPLALSSLIEVGRKTDGFDTYTAAGLLKSIFGAYKYDRETFNYKQPENLLRNADLQALGNMIGSGVDGVNTFREFEMPYWTDGSVAATGAWYIRIFYDPLGNEISRYAVIDDNGGFPAVAMSSPIEVSEGDIFSLSFQFKTGVSYIANGSVFTKFRIEVFFGPSANDSIVLTGDNVGSGLSWKGFPNNQNVSDLYQHYWPGPTNTNQWSSVTLENIPIPQAGLLRIYLAQTQLLVAPIETNYNSFQFSIKFAVNDTTKIIGHVHTSSQQPTIKNNGSGEIFLDDSPRNSINGTMFLESTTGVLRDRTLYWQRGGVTESRRLGDIITGEQLFWRKESRLKLEGTMRGLIQTYHISMLSLFTVDYHPGLNFIPGMLEIDYRNDTASGTLWELYQDGEEDSDLLKNYEFKYLYDSK